MQDLPATPENSRQRANTVWRFFFSTGTILAWVVAIFASLIAFPQFIPWVAGAWLVASGALIFLNRKTGDNRIPGLGLLICVCILLIKQPGWSPPLIGLLIGCGLFSLALFCGVSSRIRVAGFLVVFILFGWFVLARSMEANRGQAVTFESDRPVVCLGDSLTDFGYPDELRTLVSIPVVDFGQNGLTAERGTRRLPEIIALNPQVVIVELGGHDYKDGKTREQTRDWLVEIIERADSIDAQVVLVEIPRGFITDPFAGLERELCGEFDLQLIPDTMIRRCVFWSPIVPPGSWVSSKHWLSDDGLHPNENGNKMFASSVSKALVKLYGDGIRR